MSVFISYLIVILKIRSILFFIADMVTRFCLKCLYTIGHFFTTSSISLSLVVPRNSFQTSYWQCRIFQISLSFVMLRISVQTMHTGFIGF